MKKRALVLVDIQNDFMSWGALPVTGGEEIVSIANDLMDKFDVVVASQDWHPANHGSFAANHPWRKPGQVIDLNGLQQVLWTMHCVQNTFGAEFHEELNTEKIDKIFQKGTDEGIDSYSSFFDNGHKKSTGLGNFLIGNGVEEVFVMGLATDYCVKYTALDSVGLNFKTNLIIDGCRGVNREEGDAEKAIKEMEEKGVILINSNNI